MEVVLVEGSFGVVADVVVVEEEVPEIGFVANEFEVVTVVAVNVAVDAVEVAQAVSKSSSPVGVFSFPSSSFKSRKCLCKREEIK